MHYHIFKVLFVSCVVLNIKYYILCFPDCPPFTFGTQCENRCFCHKSKSLSCDKDTGDCVCKKGWTGARCTCRGRTECGENSYCYDDDRLCLDGFFTKPSNCSGNLVNHWKI